MESMGDLEKDCCCSSSHFPTDRHYYSGVFLGLNCSGDHKDDEADADESYIEISLERRQPPPRGDQAAVAAAAAKEEKEGPGGGEEDDDDPLEFRISFSSSAAAACLFSPTQHVDDQQAQQPQPQPQLLLPSTDSASVTAVDPTSASSLSSSSATPMEGDDLDVPKISDGNNGESSSSRMGCRVRFPEEHDNIIMGQVQNTATLSFSCLRAFSAPNRRDEADGKDKETVIIERCDTGHRHHGTAARVHSWKLLRNRKVTRVKTAINGGIMKLFIKFRSIKIRSVLSSYAKTRDEEAVSDSQHHKISDFSLTAYSNTIFENDGDDDTVTKTPSSSHIRDRMSKNIDDGDSEDGSNDVSGYDSFSSFRKTRSAAGSNVATRKGGNTSRVITRSCPSSVKCSPIHRSNNYNKDAVTMSSKIYTIQENSVEAAIAYCKGSTV